MKHITVKVLNSYKMDISPMGGISIQERRCQGEFSQGIFFIYAAANIRLRWQIPDSILAAQKKYCSKENLARMVKYRVKTIKKDEKNL